MARRQPPQWSAGLAYDERTQRGTVLPPVSVVPIGEMYAIRDGHHRVSVAKARGAMTIDASVDRV